MIEYKVRALEKGGTADIEKVCNDAAQQGWRLVSTAAANAGRHHRACVPVLRAGGR